MKKAILATFLTLAGSAMAQSSPSYARLCGLVAEISVSVAESARLDVPWSTVAEANKAAFSGSERNPIENMSEGVMLKAYYEWSRFDESTIKQLAFMHCSAQESAVRRKYREQ